MLFHAYITTDMAMMVAVEEKDLKMTDYLLVGPLHFSIILSHHCSFFFPSNLSLSLYPFLFLPFCSSFSLLFFILFFLLLLLLIFTPPLGPPRNDLLRKNIFFSPFHLILVYLYLFHLTIIISVITIGNVFTASSSSSLISS